MKHKKWIRHIHLLRSGELSMEEEQALNIHLSQCEGCKAVYEQVQLDWIKVMGETAGEPITRNPGQINENILSAINTPKPAFLDPVQRDRARETNVFFHPTVRLGLQLASLVLLAVFLVEQYEVTHSVQRLERQMHSQVVQTSYSQVRIIPPRFRKQALRMVKNQLEKRGAPSKRIDRLIHDLEQVSSDSAVIHADRRNIGRIERRIFDHFKKIKSLQADWRQP